MRVAILDDYQNVALAMADWSAVARSAEIVVFNDHIADPAALVEQLQPFDVLCVSFSHLGQRPGHAPHRLRPGGSLSDFFPRRSRDYRGKAARKRLTAG